MKTLSPEIEILRELQPGEVARLQAIAEIRAYAPGEIIVKQGSLADAVYVILAGSVRVTALLGDHPAQGTEADEEVVVELGPGEVVGELSFVTGEAPTLSVIAQEAATVAALPQAALRALIDQDAVLCRKLLSGITRTLVARLRDTGRELVLSRYFIRGR